LSDVKRPKLRQLENFLTKPESDESRNYISDILSGATARPEDLFVQKFLSVDFWKELGFSDNEIKIEYPAGAGGRVEITLLVEGQKIAIECKRPYLVKNGEIIKHELNGDDILELKDQISQYLLSHSFVVFTNGFHWYFYSRESYSVWSANKNKKDVKLSPYFDHITYDQLFSESLPHYILNILQRYNILEALSGMGDQSIRHFLTDEFFVDLKSWVGFIDDALKKTPSDVKARTTSLVNKLIFVRTMEGVGIIPNGFLAALWDNRKGVRNSTVDFIDHIDDELTEIYDTELFTSKYIVDEDGDPIIKDGLPQYSKERQKNYAYKALPEDFMTAILHTTDRLNLNDSGKTRVILDGKDYYIRSLYWWRFEAIPADILGKAYETYLARERKKLGIFYTPHQMTEYLTSNTVGSMFNEKISLLKNELKNESWDVDKIKTVANQIHDIKICDPSCGSGSFLIQAIRIIWKKYLELENIVRELDEKMVKGKALLDDYFTAKVGIIKYLEVLFRVTDRKERIGTLILRHIFGNDKDIKAIDTAKLNIWLECLRLDPNSYRKDVLRGKRHALPNLELNFTVGDSLIGLDTESTEKTMVGLKSSLQSVFKLREKYVESFEKTSIAQTAVEIRRGLQGFIDHDFANSLGMEYSLELLKILEPTHWSLQHWDAFYDKNGELRPVDQRGFDVIIGNPPWEILKPNIDEFFSPFHNQDDPDKFRSLNKNEKNKFIETLLKDRNVSVQYENYKNAINVQRKYYAKTKSYKFQTAKTDSPQNSIDINLYKLFLEKYYSLLKKDGMAGIVLPASFLLDLGSKGLRRLLIDNTKIIKLYDFENKYGIFEEIHRQYRFITLVFRKGEKTTTFNSAFHLRDVNKLSTIDNEALVYDIDLIKRTSPDTLAILECKNQVEVDILKKLYKYPLLAEKSSPDWKIRFQREFHMTGDAHLFNTEKKGFVLYEGKMIHQYNHKYLEPRYWIEPNIGKKALLESQTKRVIKEINKITKNKKDRKLPEIKIDCDFYRLGWRDVTNAVDYRTLICTILPPNVFLGQTISYLRPNYFDGEEFHQALTHKEMLYLCGMFNSLALDFIIRHRVGLHATMSIVYELPVPRLKEGDKYFSEIVERVAKLVCTSSEYDDLRKELKLDKGELDPTNRENLISEIDAYVAKIYKLSLEELKHILGTFRLVPDQLKAKIIENYQKLD